MSSEMQNARRASHRSLNFGVCAIALMAGTGLVAPTSAHADAAPDAAVSTKLEEIVVTAQKKSENLQSAPISATVLSSQTLRDEGINGIQELQNMAPGLSIQPPVTSETFINIRGVGIQQTNPTSSNGVAFYVDGMYVPSLIDTVDSFYDLANVEVLRGPQGTLTGSNADGGAIFVNSAKPNFNGVNGYIQQTLGNYNERRTEGAIDVPLSDQFAARIAFVTESRDSFTTNLGAIPAPAAPSNLNQPGNVDYQAVRLQLTWRPDPSFEATVRFEPYQSRTDGFAVKPDMASLPSTSPSYDPYAASIQNKPFVIDYNTPQYYNISGERTSLNAGWALNDAIRLTSITSLQTGYEKDLTDIDASSAPSNITDTRKATFRTITQELNLVSTNHSALQWVVGAYYLNQHDPIILAFNPGPAADAISDHRNIAVYASGTYKFTPQFSLTVGGRYSHDSQPYAELGCSGFPQVCGNFYTSNSKTTGSAKLAFQATPETLLYASIATGYKAGGVNLQIPDIGFTPPAFKPETNRVEEIGLKTTVLDHRLRFDVDGFYSNYNNYQLQEFLGGLPNTQGPGEATIYGGEAELTGHFNDLQFNVGGSYMHGTVSKDFNYIDPTGVAPIVAGTRIPYAPEWTLGAAVQYDLHTLGGLLTPRLQYQYQASQYFTIIHIVSPGPDQLIPSHATLDFRLTYKSSARWSIEGYVTNFTNRIYIAQAYASPQPTANDLAYGAPRQFGARLRFQF
jgi:iron complex outermembrane receptor protein